MYLSLMEKLQNSSTHILSLADRCVKCGLCLPQCPTYALSSNENESPRGRIALVQGWLSGELSLSPVLTKHLDQCLLCRRCERVCPSQVAYGEIMDQSKALISQQTELSFSFKKIVTNINLKLALNKKILPTFIYTLRALQKSGILNVARKSGLLKITGMQRLTSYLPPLDKALKTKPFYPAANTKKGNVALFTGCLSKQIDPKTVTASIKLLNLLGYGVYVPEQQVCCGALHLHEGNKKDSIQFAEKNTSVFNQQKEITAIVSLVNGCTSQLREYTKLGVDEKFTHKVKDIVEFLAESDWPENIKIQPFDKKVALQIPCTLQNILRAEDKLVSLLNRIPKLTLNATYNKCCGAAGSYFLHQPQLSDQLKQQAVNHLKQSLPDYIVSSNLGCALQLQSGLTLTKNKTKVIHPVVLLEQQLLVK